MQSGSLNHSKHNNFWTVFVKCYIVHPWKFSVCFDSDMPDAVKESVVGLGAMTDSILPKQGFDGDELDLKQVHQDDDYST